MLDIARQLSPIRNTTQAESVQDLAIEQVKHFGLDPNTAYGQALQTLATQLYHSNVSLHQLWQMTLSQLGQLDTHDRIAYFNAKRFLCFQLAKLLDSMQNPMRSLYQSLTTHQPHCAARGVFPLFDNVSALFSATPVIARTATYLFACTQWIEDAFNGREPLHEIYSRLLNPTSISLANHIVDIECGERAHEYMAWNFNSGMAAVDGLLAHLIGYEDIILVSRNVYGGVYQLIQDWYGKGSNLNVAIEWFDGYDKTAFARALASVQQRYADRLTQQRQIYVYLESPCNPHGYVLDVPAISLCAHQHGWMVICDETVGTPFLHPSLKRADARERPDFVIHSYTKDLCGTGTTTAGVVIGRNELMFMPKGERQTLVLNSGQSTTVNWDETLFWNVYYIKGAFLAADQAFEVLNGMKTYELRMLQKAINTLTLATALDWHPQIQVHCAALSHHPNHAIFTQVMHLGLPAGLFTIDFEALAFAGDYSLFYQFLDSLEPALGMQVSLGQTHTTALCPALTSHSELDKSALAQAGITPTTVRISVGLEDPRTLLHHLQRSAQLTLDAAYPGFSQAFARAHSVDALYQQTYLQVHRAFIEHRPE